MGRHHRRSARKPASLEDRYIGELGNGGTRDDMLQALCRIADELKRRNDGQIAGAPPNVRVK